MNKNILNFVLMALLSVSLTMCKKDAEEDIVPKEEEKGYQWDVNVISKALETNYIHWENDPSPHNEYTGYMVLYSGKALNYMSLIAFNDPEDKYPHVTIRVVQQLKYVISGGKEPCCRGTIAGWADNSLAQSLALAKHTEKIWSQFSEEEIAKFDLLMSSMAIAGNYCQNSQNKVHYGLYQYFNWRKGYNPNLQEGYIGVMIAAWIYFGDEQKVNEIFSEFNYDDYMAQFESYGFVNIKSCWSQTGKAMMELGGTDKGGGITQGVKIPFTYSSLVDFGEVAYDPYLLYRDLATRMYIYEVTSSECGGLAYILDGSTSPYEGQLGMCYEFRTADASGCRSAVSYCYDGWMNNILTLATLQSFDLLPEGISFFSLASKIKIGSEDLMYKLKRGYKSHKNGKTNEETEAELVPLGLDFIKEAYAYFDSEY